MRAPFPLALLLATTLLPAAARADAATEARLRDALRSATAQVRALEDERNAWKAAEAGLRAELEEARRHAEAARRQAGDSRGGSRKAAELAARLDELVAAAARDKAALGACQQASAEAAERARVAGEERARQQAAGAELAERLRASEQRNDRLYAVGKELIDWLDRVGIGGALAAREPFLGLRRVELENAAQAYADKLLEHKARP